MAAAAAGDITEETPAPNHNSHSLVLRHSALAPVRPLIMMSTPTVILVAMKNFFDFKSFSPLFLDSGLDWSQKLILLVKITMTLMMKMIEKATCHKLHVVQRTLMTT